MTYTSSYTRDLNLPIEKQQKLDSFFLLTKHRQEVKALVQHLYNFNDYPNSMLFPLLRYIGHNNDEMDGLLLFLKICGEGMSSHQVLTDSFFNEITA